MSERINLLQGLRYPTPEEFRKLGVALADSWEQIRFEEIGDRHEEDFFDMFRNIELGNLYREFNGRVFNTEVAYKLVVFFYNRGIPDEPWFQSPGKDGRSTDYFPRFTEDVHFVNHFWFYHYADSFYSQFQGIVDFLYHVIKVKYDFDVKKNIGLQRVISFKLEEVEPELEKVLQDYRKKNSL
ncbi:Cthe_2314 family HEPN domain-containing protein [Shouchella lonarensis]|nr:Cthe_2314 family HEPN domain-containing protein [Shouchella lonarensis]